MSKMADQTAISEYLADVLKDWQASRNEFPRNVYLGKHWPIPFFGNPASAIIATVGVNPSSSEFLATRNWDATKSAADWERRLTNYFNLSIYGAPVPPHEWFFPWRVGPDILRLSYEEGTAFHLDVSYRPTLAMLKNGNTDPVEFRRMIERDVKWVFRLLLLCPKLRLLLIFGPVIRVDGSPESLAEFLSRAASQYGFAPSLNGKLWKTIPSQPSKFVYIHEVSWPGEKCVLCRVVKNIYAYRDDLSQKLSPKSDSPLLP